MQLVELQSNYAEFQARGAEIVALVVNTLETVEEVASSLSTPYLLLSDMDHQVSEVYGVYNLLGDQLAAPSVFVIDTDGRILWSHIGQNANDRVASPQILDQLP